jgi:hypothetical protein
MTSYGLTDDSACAPDGYRAISRAVSRSKGFYRAVVVAGLLLIGNNVNADNAAPRRAPAAQTRTTKPVPKKLAATPRAEPTPPAPSANAVMTSYQRVGRDIMQLQNLRGTECTLELWKTFRTIKLDDATATKESRIATAATLHGLQVSIERRKGITIRHECLNNPLAEECQ